VDGGVVVPGGVGDGWGKVAEAREVLSLAVIGVREGTSAGEGVQVGVGGRDVGDPGAGGWSGAPWQALRASRARPMNASREDPEEGFHRTGTATDILRLRTLLGIGALAVAFRAAR
jgi:hypothetical protein